ncbi:hypothetical protein GCM10027168_11510 [Streptomyces capparidis]
MCGAAAAQLLQALLEEVLRGASPGVGGDLVGGGTGGLPLGVPAVAALAEFRRARHVRFGVCLGCAGQRREGGAPIVLGGFVHGLVSGGFQHDVELWVGGVRARRVQQSAAGGVGGAIQVGPGLRGHLVLAQDRDGFLMEDDVLVHSPLGLAPQAAPLRYARPGRCRAGPRRSLLTDGFRVSHGRLNWWSQARPARRPSGSRVVMDRLGRRR